jgi:DNA anti-recombination protein RmuC
MEAVRDSWTDERLDEFGKRVDERFDRVDERFDRVDQQFSRVDRQFDRVNEEFRALRGEMRAGFDRIDGRLDAMQRTMIQFAGAMVVAMVGLYGTLAGLVVTQL